MQFLFYYFVCFLAIFLFIKIFIWKDLVGYLVSLHKLSPSKTPRLLVYMISLIKTFIHAVLLNAVLLKSRKNYLYFLEGLIWELKLVETFDLCLMSPIFSMSLPARRKRRRLGWTLLGMLKSCVCFVKRFSLFDMKKIIIIIWFEMRNYFAVYILT